VASEAIGASQVALCVSTLDPGGEPRWHSKLVDIDDLEALLLELEAQASRRLIATRPAGSKFGSQPRHLRNAPGADSAMVGCEGHVNGQLWWGSPTGRSERFSRKLRARIDCFSIVTAFGDALPLDRELPKTRSAVSYAARMHAGQSRADGSRFITHPLEVAALLCEAGAADPLIAAGVLHDVLEKTAAAAGQLETRFGGEVATLVLAVTEDERIGRYEDRKASLREQVSHAGEDALMLFAADKISKIRELPFGPTIGPDPSTSARVSATTIRRRLQHYRQCLELLEALLPASPLTEQLRDELQTRAPRGAAGHLASTTG
jgi:hypothetical protein